MPPRHSRKESCIACGRPLEGRYCHRCGTDNSEAARRHWSVMDQYETAARKAVRKAKMDRRLYGPENCPPLTQMVAAVAEAMAEPKVEVGSGESRQFFPAIGPQSDDGLWVEKVVEIALGRLDFG